MFNNSAGTALPWPDITQDLFLPPVSVKASRPFLTKMALWLLAVGVLVLCVSYGPGLYFWVSSQVSESGSNYGLSSGEASALNTLSGVTRSTYQPAFNPRLPKSNKLVISRLGITTEVGEATYDNHEAALKKGVWRVSDFGSPSDNSKPTILAAHRYGYLAWSNLYRRQNSFYNLPKLKVGDVVEIDWMQRKYMYEVYAEGTGAEITDYNADLILYTCVSLSGEERIFKYAKLLEM